MRPVIALCWMLLWLPATGCGHLSIFGQKVGLVAHPPFIDPASSHPASLMDETPPVVIALRQHQAHNARNLFSLDVPDFKKHFVRQREPEWCWAACIQMILGHKGIEVTQEEAAALHKETYEKRFNRSEGDAASIVGVCNAFERPYEKIPETSRVIAFPFVKTMHEAVEDIHFGYPLIALLLDEGNMGHAYVLTGVDMSLASRCFLAAILHPERKPLAPPEKKAQDERKTLRSTQEGPSNDGLLDINAKGSTNPANLADPAFHLRLGDAFTGCDVVVHNVRLVDPLSDHGDPIQMTGKEFKDKLRYAVRIRVVPQSETQTGR
ncbi:MAG: C39 family peptidase [Planctomycetes bacterium]|nr:C39 family peptidase [Planctomycetota bacterium]